MTKLFDLDLRALRRDRAARVGPELFLYERAFADCLERVALVQRRFEHALLIGCPDPSWPERLRPFALQVDPHDPGPKFARMAGGQQIVEDEWQGAPRTYDLVLSIGTLDTVNQLPDTFRSIARSMRPDALFIGAVSGGDTLPQLRSALRAADAVVGEASAHVHPRIEASALAPLLSSAGFGMPVVDVDRVQVSYPSIDGLIADLRAMGVTNILRDRSRRPLSRVARAAAAECFARAGTDGRTVETCEIIHFAAWTPAPDARQQ